VGKWIDPALLGPEQRTNPNAKAGAVFDTFQENYELDAMWVVKLNILCAVVYLACGMEKGRCTTSEGKLSVVNNDFAPNICGIDSLIGTRMEIRRVK
jgi:hypothetical protein